MEKMESVKSEHFSKKQDIFFNIHIMPPRLIPP